MAKYNYRRIEEVATWDTPQSAILENHGYKDTTKRMVYAKEGRLWRLVRTDYPDGIDFQSEEDQKQRIYLVEVNSEGERLPAASIMFFYLKHAGYGRYLLGSFAPECVVTDDMETHLHAWLLSFLEKGLRVNVRKDIFGLRTKFELENGEPIKPWSKEGWDKIDDNF